ncbi:MAG: ABC transporter permease [Thermomicrobiales bacterium]|nr:MAG: ABC transporter permease [Thermomicrobiales bacterium]
MMDPIELSGAIEEPALIDETLARGGRKYRTNFQLAVDRFRRQKLGMVGFFIVLSLLLVAIFAPWIAPTHYATADLMAVNIFPNRDYPMGTDQIGHNYLSRVIYGIRTSYLVGFLAVIVACFIGIPLGLAAGLRGGKTDFVVMRIIEIMTAFPGLLFAIFLLSVVNSGVMNQLFGNQVLNVVFVIGVTTWVGICRLTRAQMLSLRERDFVEAAEALGATKFQIAVRHLLPNAIPPLIISITLLMPTAIFAEAGLSFLGLGLNEPVPSLGKMVADSRQYIQLYWYLGLFPTLAIALTVIGFAFLGDGLRDALDPRQN